MNQLGFDLILSRLNIERVSSLCDADIIYSPSEYMNTEQFPDKKYIFGPHFSVFPNPAARSISGKFNNAVYIQPSQPSVDTWVNEFNFKNIPVKVFPFPLNIEEYKPSAIEKDIALIYFKRRRDDELKLVEQLLISRDIKYEIVKYGSYDELVYQSKLDRSRFVFCLGRHESQGFAIQSALSKNIPMIVWDVSLRKQEVGYEAEYANIQSPVTTVPYWNIKCGEKFYNSVDMTETFDKFINNLDSYNPREMIKNSVSPSICSDNFLYLINSIGS